MSEFSFIEKIRNTFSDIPSQVEGIGDDCAIMPSGKDRSLVYTTDALVENVHFLTAATTARELGRKALMVNLSDVAAMGAKPVATLLSIAMPKEKTGEWAEEFMLGYSELSHRFSVALIGGDTTLSKSGVMISVTAIGEVKNANIKRRRDASAGDIIFAGDILGDSAQGLKDILAGDTQTLYAQIHRNPQAQILEGEWLGAREDVHAMMDLSDGLASDLRHILHQSSVSAEIWLEKIPHRTSIENALSGGEDYKLLFTADEASSRKLCSDFSERFGYDIHAVGRILQKQTEDILWKENGVAVNRTFVGFEHF